MGAVKTPAKTKPSLSTLINVRVTADTAASWRADAAAAGMGLSDLVRARMTRNGKPATLTGRPTPRRGRGRGSVPTADPALIAQLAWIGNNVNQIARHVNSTRELDMSVLTVMAAVEVELGDIRVAVTQGHQKAT